MRITIENTDQIVLVNDGMPARIWIGKTDSGVEVELLVPRIAVRAGQDVRQFERELQEQPAPHVSEAFPLRMIL